MRVKITRRDVVIAVILAAVYCYLAFRVVLPSEFSKPLRSATVTFDGFERSEEYVLTDPAFLHEAITEPLSKAKLDRSGSQWVALGSMRLEFTDGTESSLSMYLPWGQVSQERLYTVDFSLLRSRLEKEFAGPDHHRQVIFHDEY
jgi:hypothetical protein